MKCSQEDSGFINEMFLVLPIVFDLTNQVVQNICDQKTTF